jgi:hypothetical protein
VTETALRSLYLWIGEIDRNGVSVHHAGVDQTATLRDDSELL